MTTLASLLHPAYEPGDGIANGAQLVDGQWWHPVLGCDSLQVVVDNARSLLNKGRGPLIATPGEEYQDDDGLVLWWRFPGVEPPWAGTPNDCDWPGYHTHFTSLPPYPVAPIQLPKEAV